MICSMFINKQEKQTQSTFMLRKIVFTKISEATVETNPQNRATIDTSIVYISAQPQHVQIQ